MTTPPRKRRELIQEHAPWFKLSHYEALKDAAPDIWYTQFALRIDLQRLRSLLKASDDAYAEMRRSIYQQLITILRCKGVLRGKALNRFLVAEEFLYPETFSIFRDLSSEGVYVREMSWGDYSRVETALGSACGGMGGAVCLDPARERVSSDPLSKHVHPSMLAASEAFLTIDLRCSRALIIKQVAELVDQLSQDRARLLPPTKQTKLPSYEAWHRSRVLAYLDLRQWIDTAEDKGLRQSVKDSDVAQALNIDPKQLADTTKKHAEELTDPFSWTFMHLAESAISSRRAPMSRLRVAKRASHPPKN